MKSTQLIILIIVALVICAGAIKIYQSRNNAATTPETSAGIAAGSPLISGLNEQVESIATIKVAGDTETLVLKRGDDGEWVIESRNDYPADPSKISTMMVELSGILVADRLTDKPEKYEKLGVAGQRGSGGALTLNDTSGATLLHLLLGNQRKVDPGSREGARPGGRYFRINNDPNVYLADASLYSLTPSITSWVDTKILNIPSTEIISMEVDHGSTESITVSWETGSPILKGIEEGMTVKRSMVSSLRSSLGNVSLSDVKSAGDNDGDIPFKVTCTARTKDGTVYTARLGTSDSKYYLALRCSYDAPFLTDDDKATTESIAAAETKAEKARAVVPEFNERHEPWIYEISKWNFDKLNKTRSEIIEAEKEETKIPPAKIQ